MRIALMYPKSLLASWLSLGGYRETLVRMGHKVFDYPLPGNKVENVEKVRKDFPSINELNRMDCVLSMFHEYVQPWLVEIYGFEAWQKLDVPVIARFDESMDRNDLNLPQRVEELKKWATSYSWPAAQDAARHGGQWLPFGCDVEMFKRPSKPVGKKYDLAFIGSMYPYRAKYLGALDKVMLDDQITFTYNQVISQDLGGIRERESTEMMAANYQQIKIFFCLPPMSRLIVAKVVDVLASRTFLMYPKLPGDTAKNMDQFEDGKHLVYYEAGHLKKNAEQIRYWLEHSTEREAIAEAGCELVHREHTLTQMLEKLLTLSTTPSKNKVVAIGAT